MGSNNFATPILFIIFNRPDCTQQVFERIRSIQPKRLFIAADGPRANRPEDIEKCRVTRNLIQVDWDCDIQTLFYDTNLGCKKAPSEAINWFFQHVEEGIILEDDCLPDPTFFQFCKENLEKYRDDKRIMEIVGTNFLAGNGYRRDQDYSYYFSHFAWTWGWATWKRAWSFYDIEMHLYPEIKTKGYLQDICLNEDDFNYRSKCFDGVFTRKLDTAWDYQWQFSRLINNGLSIIPINNLVLNIGFGIEATHTKNAEDLSKFIVPVSAMNFPLKHPPFVIRDTASDKYFIKFFFPEDSRNKTKKKIWRIARFLGMEKIMKRLLLTVKKNNLSK